MKKLKYKPHNTARDKESAENIKENKFPRLYDNRENCCGCSACYVSCPVNAIEMQPDAEGFLYPVINIDKCICCYKCIMVCSFKRDQRIRGL